MARRRLPLRAAAVLLRRPGNGGEDSAHRAPHDARSRPVGPLCSLRETSRCVRPRPAGFQNSSFGNQRLVVRVFRPELALAVADRLGLAREKHGLVVIRSHYQAPSLLLADLEVRDGRSLGRLLVWRIDDAKVVVACPQERRAPSPQFRCGGRWLKKRCEPRGGRYSSWLMERALKCFTEQADLVI